MGRDGRGVEIDKVKTLVVSEVRFAKQLNVFRHLRSTAVSGTTGVDTGTAAGKATGVGGGKGTRKSVEPLESDTVGIFPLNFNLGRVAVGEPGAVQLSKTQPSGVLAQQLIAIASRGQTRSQHVIEFCFPAVNAGPLLQIPPVLSDVAEA